VAFVAMGLGLAGCKGKTTTDLATEPAADLGIQQVVVKIQGLEYLKDDDSTVTLEFGDEEQVDLTDFFNGNTIRLFTDETLSDGHYVGVRLLLDTEDDDAYVLDANSAKQTLAITTGGYAAIDFTSDKSSTSTNKQSLTLTLDLRQSLSVDDSSDYELQPVLRSVETDKAGALQGAVTATCASTGDAAVYLFEGEDDTPDDIDGQAAEPYATVPVTYNSTTGTGSYVARFLPAATYTVAIACSGDEDIPTTDDDVDFRDPINIEIEESKTTTKDLT